MKKFINVNGVTLCIEDSEEKEKKPMLFFHGLTANKESMYIVAHMFSDMRRTICVDTRGHGESTHPANYSLADHAKDVHALIDELNLGAVDIMGCSMGSYISLAAAEYRSEDIDHLVLLCTKPFGTTSSIERIAKERGLDMCTLTDEQLMQIAMSCAFAPSSLEKLKTGELKFSTARGGVALTPEEVDAESRSLADFDNSKEYDKVTCKTLVISGEYDGINPPDLGKQVADGIQGAEYVMVKDAGHMIPLEKTDEFIKIVSEFLNK